MPAPVSYDLKATIDPALGTISVRGKMEVPLQEGASPTIEFGLHQTFELRKLSVNNSSATFSLRPMEPSLINPATKRVLVELPHNFSGNMARLEIEYGGSLKQIPEFGTFPDQHLALDDQINSRLIELACYSSWYPQFFPMGYPINVKLEVSLPLEWVAICSGKKLEDVVRGKQAITRWVSLKDTDILIAASPNYKRRANRLSGADIEIYYTRMPEEFVEKELRQIEEIMRLFTERLGETTIPAGMIKHVYSPKLKGQGRAGIARPGMIVTSEGLTLETLAKDPKFSLFQDIAHEIAHFWWNFGAGQGDWINEAFAEYFSVLAVEGASSKEGSGTVIDTYRKQVQALPATAPSLSTVPFDGSSFVVRYYKGSLMLDYLRNVLGDAGFFRGSRDFFRTYRGKSIGTREFRIFWNERLSSQRESIDAWLDLNGALPASSNN